MGDNRESFPWAIIFIWVAVGVIALLIFAAIVGGTFMWLHS